jgi:hypothetical protein
MSTTISSISCAFVAILPASHILHASYTSLSRLLHASYTPRSHAHHHLLQLLRIRCYSIYAIYYVTCDPASSSAVGSCFFFLLLLGCEASLMPHMLHARHSTLSKTQSTHIHTYTHTRIHSHTHTHTSHHARARSALKSTLCRDLLEGQTADLSSNLCPALFL